VLPFLKNRESTHRQYKFLIPGLGFELFVGRAIPAPVRRMCMVRSPEGLLFTSEKMEEATLAEMAKLLLRPRQP
jgi:hypothetical protein